MVLLHLKKLLLIMVENRYVQSVYQTLLSDSIFNSSKISFHKLMSYIQLMSFNVPLELICEVLDIASNTAELWRKKIFSTVDNYQDHLKLYNRVWIDETYTEDYQVLESNNNEKHPRGLSKTKICIVVAIDSSLCFHPWTDGMFQHYLVFFI